MKCSINVHVFQQIYVCITTQSEWSFVLHQKTWCTFGARRRPIHTYLFCFYLEFSNPLICLILSGNKCGGIIARMCLCVCVMCMRASLYVCTGLHCFYFSVQCKLFSCSNVKQPQIRNSPAHTRTEHTNVYPASSNSWDC